MIRQRPLGIHPISLCLAFFAVAAVLMAESLTEEAAAVRLLVSPGTEMEGKMELEALVIDPEVRRLVFSIDGEEVAVRRRPPWNVKVELARPAREQVVEVTAWKRDAIVGTDRAIVNRLDPPYRLELGELKVGEGVLQLEGSVSVPRKAELERVEIFLGESRVGLALTSEFQVEIPRPNPTPGDFVRAEAVLADGRSIDAVRWVEPPEGVADEIDVNLVQLQVLATRRNGAPVTDLTAADFSIEQGGEEQELEQLRVAEDVGLVLGLVLDSSGSMLPIWGETLNAAESFLRETLGEEDRAFLVDFDQQLRLMASLSSEVDTLVSALDRLEPEGGTALYDSVLFSLLQFRDEPGRRALVVLTDGFDVHSTADPKRAVEFGRKLGVPVYIIALDDPTLGGTRNSELAHALRSKVQELKLLTEPTGGRLLRVPPSPSGIDRAFRQIHHELSHQYVLTYYTDELPDDRRQKVEVEVSGRRGVDVRAVFGLDQIL